MMVGGVGGRGSMNKNNETCYYLECKFSGNWK